MDETPKYAVTIVDSSDSPFLTSGGTERRRTIRYKIDTLGPFTLEYPVLTFSAAAVQADIAKHVSEMRKLNMMQF
jgi:hypothetical protein